MIEISMDHVILFNQKIVRPVSVSVSQWYEFWEAVRVTFEGE